MPVIPLLTRSQHVDFAFDQVVRPHRSYRPSGWASQGKATDPPHVDLPAIVRSERRGQRRRKGQHIDNVRRITIVKFRRDFYVLVLRQVHSTEQPSRGCPHLIPISQLNRLWKCGNALLNEESRVMSGFEPSTFASRNRHANNMTNMLQQYNIILSNMSPADAPSLDIFTRKLRNDNA